MLPLRSTVMLAGAGAGEGVGDAVGAGVAVGGTVGGGVGVGRVSSASETVAKVGSGVRVAWGASPPGLVNRMNSRAASATMSG